MFTLRRILALFKAAPLTPYDAALRELAHGRPQEALQRLDALLAQETQPQERARISNKRGVALMDLQRSDQADRAFRYALECVPAFAPALVNLGNLALEDGRESDAVALYEQAIAADEYSAAAHRHLGLAYKRLGRRSEAMRAFARARRLEGRSARGQSK